MPIRTFEAVSGHMEPGHNARVRVTFEARADGTVGLSGGHKEGISPFEPWLDIIEQVNAVLKRAGGYA